MVTDERELRDNIEDEDWLNAIRNNASVDYRARIPEATQANIQDTVQKLVSNRPLMNEAINVLVNRIGAVIYADNLSFVNPLGKFKRESMMYGDTIEEIMVGLIDAQEYDGYRDELEKEVFGAMTPEVQASYHRVNRRNKYKLTVREPQMRQAFLSSGGVSQFITNLMSSQQTSDAWDEYLAMANLFGEYERADGFFKVQVPDLVSTGATDEDARVMLKEFRKWAGRLPFPSRNYNAAGMPSSARPEQLELFITPEAESTVDVDALAGAFNIDRANFKFRKNVILPEHFNIPGAQAILTTPNFFVVADQLIETTSIENPANLARNFWLHHWQAISASRFVPAILFTTEPGTPIVINPTPVTGVTDITVYDRDNNVTTNATRGQFYNVVAQAETEGVNDAVRYEVEGKQSVHTDITQNGVLIVGPDEPATSLTIKAYAVDTEIPQLLSEASVNVIGDLVTVWPQPNVKDDEDGDGVFEVTPVEPLFDGSTIAIPTVPGVEYQIDGSPVTGDVDIDVETTVTAVAESGNEIAAGAETSWTFTP